MELSNFVTKFYEAEPFCCASNYAGNFYPIIPDLIGIHRFILENIYGFLSCRNMQVEIVPLYVTCLIDINVIKVLLKRW
jgi:hypothetical protein